MGIIEFSIPDSGGQTLAALFSLIEKEKADLYIEEYSVFQTTLDQVEIVTVINILGMVSWLSITEGY